MNLTTAQEEAQASRHTIDHLNRFLRNPRRNLVGKLHVGGMTGPIRPINKIGRNEKCPCNSGKKWKHCHGNTRELASAQD